MLPADQVDRRDPGPPPARRPANGGPRSPRPPRRHSAADEGPHPVELAGLLHELTAELLAAADVPDALDRLARFAHQALPGADRCVATLVGDGLPPLAAAAGADLPGVPGPHDEGPGAAATRGRELVTTADLAADERWAGPFPAGIAVAAVPLDVRRQSVGALTVYAARDALEPGVLLTAMALAGQAEVLLAELLRRSAQAELTADLVATLRTGAVDHAVGVIVAQRGCDLPAAYTFLHETAERLGLTPAALAEKIVASAARR
ncbi:GAF and ANTAR domain-containing protein [Spirilliplanes yamanashiensis]|uniref:GAF and ANTAR domain-containing protein n=1 Tax=Spirilliplanes yamanashiensis TaxID=42233 RepID=UPI001EF19ADF|nr:GAF and ANTAR domain-containing protein [Spirilliplanes yamanashiensis]MDP9816349.1 hypothetical protein [Spirilliplanes yamanashiensis]